MLFEVSWQFHLYNVAKVISILQMREMRLKVYIAVAWTSVRVP